MSTFTEREQKLMAAACQSFEGEPKLDMDKFAQRAGLTVGSARNAWAALKKKMNAQDDTVIKGSATAKTPGTKSAKKRPPPVVLPANDNGSDDEEVPTPSKKPKTPATKGKGKGKVTKSEDDDDDDFVKVKKEVANEDFEEV
ncbi:hypothetical protein KCU62_g9515, partial [Aureobasidium sp. EXF-3399]